MPIYDTMDATGSLGLHPYGNLNMSPNFDPRSIWNISHIVLFPEYDLCCVCPYVQLIRAR